MSLTKLAAVCKQRLFQAQSFTSPNLALREEVDNLSVRFKIWAGNVGIFAEDNASVDYRVRNDQDIADVLASLLETLTDSLDEVIKSPIAEELETKDDSSSSSESSSSFISLDQDASGPIPYEVKGPMTPIQRANDVVDRLYRFAAVLRKPVSAREDVRVKRFMVERAPDETIQYEIADVEDNVRTHMAAHFKETPSVLVERFVRAAIFRRMKIHYRQRHQSKLDKEPTAPGGPTSLRHVQRSQAGTNVSKQHPELASRPRHPPNTLTVTSKTTASSVNRDKLPEYAKSTAPSHITRTALASGKLGVPSPPAPVDDHSKQSICPYCFRIITKEETEEPYWTRHVLKDIDPYICLFRDCNYEDVLFRSSKEWLEHMRWQHTAVWACQFPGHESSYYNTQTELEYHMRSQHLDILTESQMAEMVRESSQPMDNTIEHLRQHYDTGSGNPCILCHQYPLDTAEPPQAVKPTILDHVLEHLETIALLSLPEREDVDDLVSNAPQSSPGSQGSHRDWSWECEETLSPTQNLDGIPPSDDQLSVYSNAEVDELWIDVLEQSTVHFPKQNNDPLLLAWAKNLQSSEPQSFFNVPFPRDTGFYGRDDLLNQLQIGVLATQPPRRMAITGIGGVGKTQTAVELAYRIKDAHLKYDVFWVDSSFSVSSASEELILISNSLGMHVTPENVFSRIREYLEAHHRPWLLIFDNVEISMEPLQDLFLEDCIPETGNGSIIFITQNEELGDRLAPMRLTRVDLLEPQAAVTIFEKIAFTNDMRPDDRMLTLFQRLSLLPLSIRNCAELIKAAENEYEEILTAMRIPDDLPLLHKHSGQVSLDTSWSFVTVFIQPDSVAWDCLSMIACLGSAPISFQWLSHDASHPSIDTALDLLQVNSIIAIRGSSIISDESSKKFVEKNLRTQGVFTRWFYVTMRRANEIIEKLPPANTPDFKNFIFHFKHLLKSAESRQFPQERLSLLFVSGLGSFKDRQYRDAEIHLSEALRGYLKSLDPMHLKITEIVMLLSVTHCCLGQFDDAKSMIFEVISNCDQVYGPDSPQTLEYVDVLTAVHIEHGDFEKALHIQEQVFLKHYKNLDMANHDILPPNIEFLFSMYMHEPDGIDELFPETLLNYIVHSSLNDSPSKRRTPAELSPDSLAIMEKIADIYRQRLSFIQAEALLTKVISEKTRSLGGAHPSTLAVMDGLINLYNQMGQHGAADAIKEQVHMILARDFRVRGT